ncbi:MAG: SDR family NAD(P)-dependent oxidoreductase, partial [Clostridia bacterium]|nr:SDR family NAD(P)-dependent oxidoreductase [Clostridia bacterium]
MKNIVITGAGGVLCSAFARALAADGNKIALLDLNVDAAQKVADEINAEGGFAKAYKANVLDKEALEEIHDQILADFGKCDVLINGAGGNSPKCTTTHEEFEPGDEVADDISTFFNLDKDGFRFVFDLNMLGTLLPTQVFAKDMIGREGCSILNVSSMNAYRPLTKIPA